MGQERSWHDPITFTPTDGQGIKYPHEDALVISIVMEGHMVCCYSIFDLSFCYILKKVQK
jgi:hypothetical protein